MTIFFTLVNLLAIAALSYYAWKKLAASDTLTWWAGLALKLAGGLAIGLIYKYYYDLPGDTFVFFSDATKLADLAYTDTSSYIKFIFTGESPVEIANKEPRSIFFVAILSIVNIV